MAITIKKKSPDQEKAKPAKSWMKRGMSAMTAINQAEARAEEYSEERVFRFWLDKGSEADITFLDGTIDPEYKLLDCPVFYEHNMRMNGTWGHEFPCTADGSENEEPCPICQDGDRPSLVGLLSVIDHREYTSKKGKTYQNEVKLYVAKLGTLKQLTKLAQKRGGSLAGCRFDVSRIGDRAPRVGDMFDFTKQYDLDEIKEKWGKEPLPYDKVIKRLTAKELRAIGFGSPVVGSYDTDTGGDVSSVHDEL